MKKTLRSIVCVGLAGIVLSSSVFAAQKTVEFAVNESSTSHYGSFERFWPTEGNTLVNTYSDKASTLVTFSYDEDSVSFLNAARGAEFYPGIEVRDYPNSNGGGFSAYSISSTLPNPVSDLESNSSASINDEAEVTALGEIVAGRTYYFTTYWDAVYTTAWTGLFGTKAEISNQYFPAGDYNVADYINLRCDNTYSAPASTSSRSMSNTTPTSETLTSNEDGIAATITFNDYLSFEEFDEFLMSNDVVVAQLQLRGLTPSGERVSIFSRTDKGMGETERILQEQAHSSGFELVGITAICAYIEEAQKVDLEKNAFVYRVETSDYADSDVYTLMATDIGESQAKGFKKSLTWEMENAGIL